MHMVLGTIPSFEIHRGKKIENISWDRVVHPIMCSILGMVNRIIF